MQAIERFHTYLFREKAGERMKAFRSNLTYSFGGYVLASAISLATYIIAGRVLGPHEFASYGLVLALSQLFNIPVQGMDLAIMRFTALADQKKKGEIIASSFLVVVCIIVATTTLFLIISRFIGSITNISQDIVIASIVLTAVLVTKLTLDAAIRGLGAFKFQSIIRFFDACTTILVFTYAVLLAGYSTYLALIGSLIAGCCISIIIYVLYIVSHISNLTPRWNTAQESWEFGRLGIIAILGSILFLSIDKIVIHDRLGQTILGIYNAYATVSFMISMQISNILTNVLFPEAAKYPDRKKLFKKIGSVSKKLCIPLFICFAIGGYILLLFFGKKYPIDPTLVLGMALTATLYLIYNIYITVFLSFHSKVFFATAIHNAIGGAIYIVLLWTLLPTMQLIAVPFSFIVVSLYFFIVYRHWEKTGFYME